MIGSDNEAEFLWVEKYRPKKIDECILPGRIKDVLKSYVENGNIPNLLFTGPAGTGKTTAALAMCEELGINYLFINSSEERGIDVLRTKIRGYASTVSLTGGRKVIILDEADYITPEAQAALRGSIEEFSANCSFIMTCNFKSKLINAIHSRSSVIDFTLVPKERPPIALAFMKRLEGILQKEKVPYARESLANVIQKFFPDFRRTLNELQTFSTKGNIDAGVISQLSDVKNLKELVGILKEKKFSEMRKWVVLNSDVDPSRIFRKMYDEMNNILEPSSIPPAIIILARYQYQAAFVADQEINIVACLTELMVDCEFQR